MGPLLILARAAKAGVALSVRAGTVYAAPPGRLPAALVDEIRNHKSELVDLLAAPPGCTSCGAAVAAELVLCPACYSARRAPGRVIQFDPARRVRTEQRLAHRRCSDCGGSWWRVLPNGDAECESCRRARTATTATRTNSVPPGAPE